MIFHQCVASRRWKYKRRQMSAYGHSSQHLPTRKPFLTTPAGLVLIGFLAIAGFFLFTEHAAHTRLLCGRGRVCFRDKDRRNLTRANLYRVPTWRSLLMRT